MRKNQAFTLIELLVVVLIIGILAAVAVPQYQLAVEKTRYTQAMMLVENIVQSQRRYQLANGNITYHFDELDMDMPTPTRISDDDNQYTYKWGYCWLHDTGYAACRVNLSASSGAIYFARYNTSLRQCWAEPQNDSRANALCRSVTKKQTGSTSSIWTKYDF